MMNEPGEMIIQKLHVFMIGCPYFLALPFYLSETKSKVLIIIYNQLLSKIAVKRCEKWNTVMEFPYVLNFFQICYLHDNHWT